MGERLPVVNVFETWCIRSSPHPVALDDPASLRARLERQGVTVCDGPDGWIHVQCPTGWATEARRDWIRTRTAALTAAPSGSRAA